MKGLENQTKKESSDLITFPIPYSIVEIKENITITNKDNITTLIVLDDIYYIYMYLYLHKGTILKMKNIWILLLFLKTTNILFFI